MELWGTILKNSEHKLGMCGKGLDFLPHVDDIKYVINYDYPNNSEDYVHRIGRTGRRDKKV
ncbi:hypothetical protein NECAME_15289 [Necator americanus]|uniref:Helicase C-terminal domain-containing protein n=1 Tax=Necator americanus TaxID=51031 RepID=W2SII9_NECAM|nr:hypothetical protein NECAME_15289 [Necator americanus]ETN69469.1 hypothetical protein NECAME_15289 [Necator americanus]